MGGPSPAPPISQVAPFVGGNTTIPSAAPNTGGGYAATLAARESLRQRLWVGALLALLLAVAGAAGAALLPDARRGRRE